MKNKLVAAGVLACVFATSFSCACAEKILIYDCGEVCPGHCFTGENSICVVSGLHDIRLSNAHIDVSQEDGQCAFSIEPGAEVFLTVEGENSLKSGFGCAGLQVPYQAALTIMETSTGVLCVSAGDGGAGIGGGSGQESGMIQIRGGIIEAKGWPDGMNGGAGIGGGYDGCGGETVITGGIVTAKSGPGGAGIGGGCNRNGGFITISGGIVDAQADVDDYLCGAGIGGGAHGDGGKIVINGGMIHASNGYYEGSITGAGIGGGENGDSGCISIRGGVILASAGCGAAGIGSSGEGESEEICIEGGFIQASGGAEGAGIGGGVRSCFYWENSIVITGGTILATGGSTSMDSPASGAGIGGSGLKRNPGIEISGGCIEANAGQGGIFGGAGIGSGGGSGSNRIQISGGRIRANASEQREDTRWQELEFGYDYVYGGAGIGSGAGATAGEIQILGGTITANGQFGGAGIGNGELVQETIQIDGGTIDTNGGSNNGKGIDGDLQYNSGEVISDGNRLFTDEDLKE